MNGDKNIQIENKKDFTELRIEVKWIDRGYTSPEELPATSLLSPRAWIVCL